MRVSALILGISIIVASGVIAIMNYVTIYNLLNGFPDRARNGEVSCTIETHPTYKEDGAIIQNKCELVRICAPTAGGKDMECSPWRAAEQSPSAPAATK